MVQDGASQGGAQNNPAPSPSIVRQRMKLEHPEQ